MAVGWGGVPPRGAADGEALGRAAFPSLRLARSSSGHAPVQALNQGLGDQIDLKKGQIFLDADILTLPEAVVSDPEVLSSKVVPVDPLTNVGSGVCRRRSSPDDLGLMTPEP